MGSKKLLKGLHNDSLERMVKVISDPEGSSVLDLDPIGSLKPGKILKVFKG